MTGLGDHYQYWLEQARPRRRAGMPLHVEHARLLRHLSSLIVKQCRAAQRAKEGK